MKTIHRTVFQVEVLSEEPLSSDLNLAELHHFITDGAGSGVVSLVSSTELSGQDAVAAVLEQGSDPEFSG